MSTPRLFTRVHETTTTTGTGTYTLAGAVPGHVTFASRLSAGQQVWYTATDGVNWETGIGTFQVSGGTNLLERTTIVENSLGTTARIDWGAGAKDVFACPPGSRLATLTGAGKLGGEEVAFAASGKNALSLVYGAANDFMLYDNTAGQIVWSWQWNYNGSGGKRVRVPQLIYANIVDADTLRQGGADIGSAAFRTAHGPITGTSVAATATTVTLPASESTVNDIYKDLEIKFTSGPAAGQTRTIVSYVGSTRVLTVDSAFSPAPSSGGGDNYEITTGPARSGTVPILRSDGRLDPLLVGRMVGATSSAPGRAGLPPRPSAGEHVEFLRGDGTWAPPNNRFVEAWRTSWANGNTYSATHGLGTTPHEYWLELECTTAEHGYSVGDRVRLTNLAEQGTSRGATVSATATVVRVRVAANGIAIARISDTTIGVITPSSWKMRLVAQAWW